MSSRPFSAPHLPFSSIQRLRGMVLAEQSMGVHLPDPDPVCFGGNATVIISGTKERGGERKRNKRTISPRSKTFSPRTMKIPRGISA